MRDNRTILKENSNHDNVDYDNVDYDNDEVDIRKMFRVLLKEIEDFKVY